MNYIYLYIYIYIYIYTYISIPGTYLDTKQSRFSLEGSAMADFL